MQRSSFLAISLLLGLAAVIAPFADSGASARSRDGIAHTLPPGAGVRVSFDLRSGKGPLTLVRFPRNRVALVRVGDQRLALRAGHRRALLRIGSGGRVHVQIRFDLDAARISVRANGRGVAVSRRLDPEAQVVVSRTLRRLVIKPLRNRRPPGDGGATPTLGAPAAPTSGTTPVRLFAPTSVWNQPLTPNAALDPASATLVQTLRDAVAATDAWIQWQGTSPLYVVGPDQPTVRVQLDSGSWGATLQQALQAVPIPANAIPAQGSDAHLTIYQPSTDRLWELFAAQKLADGWHASWGGAMAHVSSSPGYYDADSWPGLSGPHWGATATSLPVIAGTVTADELRSGVIPHALAMNIPWAKPNVYAWPAQRTDGASTDPNAIPEGARFRLDPRLDISALHLPPVTRAVAEAAQRYGIIVRDQTGHAVGFFAENTAQFGTDPYDGPTGLFGGTPSNVLMRSFPWEHLQVVDMDLSTMR
jgi:hypothetical protein